jgi:DNA-binding MarR family transcriptional regulator/N-acetylglutamate synthase-like GNAT family acetyltransferase
MPSDPELPRRVAAVRRFNRFYTRQIGVLQQGLLRSPFSLTEVRVLYELAHRTHPTAAELGKDLELDPGYLSRILRAFARRGLLTRRASTADGRESLLGLTAKGRKTFAGLNARSDEEIAELLGRLAPAGQRRLIEAMDTIARLLGGAPAPAIPYILRPPRPGDLGWIVHRHGVLYAQEYGWDERFEGLVAGVVADFVRNHDPRMERCWIAERDGAVVGSVFLVRQSKQVAKLRLLLVEPETRGLGIGSRLVAECIGLARAVGYRKLTLWTNDVLHEARRIYQRAGFRLVREEPHDSFGHGLVGQTWELDLSGAGR